MKNWREEIFEIVETGNERIGSKVYDWLMLCMIVVSIVPLAFRQQTDTLEWLDKISVSVFIVDYLLRWMTADFKYHKSSKWKTFLFYPFTPFALIDLLSILPSFIFFNRAFKLLRITRLLKIMRVFKFVRYSSNIQTLLRVLRKERQILFTVFLIAVAYIIVTALIMFNMEELAKTVGYQVDAGGGPGGENDLLPGGRVEEGSHGVARLLIGIRRFHRQRMDGAVDVGVVPGAQLRQALLHGNGPLRSGRVVQVHEGFPVHLGVQDRELTTYVGQTHLPLISLQIYINLRYD